MTTDMEAMSGKTSDEQADFERRLKLLEAREVAPPLIVDDSASLGIQSADLQMECSYLRGDSEGCCFRGRDRHPWGARGAVAPGAHTAESHSHFPGAGSPGACKDREQLMAKIDTRLA